MSSARRPRRPATWHVLLTHAYLLRQRRLGREADAAQGPRGYRESMPIGALATRVGRRFKTISPWSIDGPLGRASALGAAIRGGRAIRERRERVEVLEQERAHATARAAAEERLRIAQELHDVVAHSLGVIAVQAGVGMKVIDTDLAEARRSFESI